MILKTASKIKDIIRLVEKVLAYASGLGFLLAIMLLTTGDVVGRYLFRSPIEGTLSIDQLLMAGIVFFSWAYVMATDSHISVDILTNHYPPRAQSVLKYIILFIALILFSVITWQGLKIVLEEWNSGRLVSIIRLPLAPFKLLIPIGAFFVCLECIIQLIQLVRQKKDRR